MPIYEYKCTECEHRLEKLQRMSDDPLKDCPACNQSALTKLVSAASFKLKGTGWYETDFKGGNKSGSDVSTKSNSTMPAKKTETKTPISKPSTE